jgi:tRNA uridine 5-carboxymethylaminomethyl modification enzyme
MLNTSKGPAVWSPRSQNDRDWYSREARRRVESQAGLDVITGFLSDITVENGEIAGVTINEATICACASLVLCNGTFLNALMHTGETTSTGGRFGEPASVGLTEKFMALGFVAGRLKTGTPPRLDLTTIDLGETEVQHGDVNPSPFSFQNDRIANRQIPMYLTYTNARTHDVLRTGFDASPLFTGRIKGVGPRYCPSIEDKINRFADRERHQIFLEPEGYDSTVVYMNGFSSSLPAHVQEEAIHTIPGLRGAKMIRSGYAVEYDFFPPHQVRHTLETKLVNGLFFAGQINGTSGYEEAAGQGLIAGINAALRVKGGDPFTLDRSEAYVGVLIDDVINKSTEEPYRIFTSRAEYRLALRQDNADTRLMRKGAALGLIPSGVVAKLEEKERKISSAKELLTMVRLTGKEIAAEFADRLDGTVPESETLLGLLKRPEVKLNDILAIPMVKERDVMSAVMSDRAVFSRVETEVKYEGYLRRQDEQIRQFQKSESMRIPEGMDYQALRSISNEAREKLSRVRPASIGQAMRISGVTPADVSVLMIALMR